MGGILVGHEVGRHLGRRHIFAEKDNGKLTLRRFEVKPGERFLVAEDVITTGSAVKEVIALVKAAGVRWPELRVWSTVVKRNLTWRPHFAPS